MNIEKVISEIDALFVEHNYDAARFTVDYDANEDGLYCYYTPFIDNTGFYVSDYLVYVEDTSVADLNKLSEYLRSKGIKYRIFGAMQRGEIDGFKLTGDGALKEI